MPQSQEQKEVARKITAIRRGIARSPNPGVAGAIANLQILHNGIRVTPHIDSADARGALLLMVEMALGNLGADAPRAGGER